MAMMVEVRATEMAMRIVIAIALTVMEVEIVISVGIELVAFVRAVERFVELSMAMRMVIVMVGIVMEVEVKMTVNFEERKQKKKEKKIISYFQLCFHFGQPFVRLIKHDNTSFFNSDGQIQNTKNPNRKIK